MVLAASFTSPFRNQVCGGQFVFSLKSHFKTKQSKDQQGDTELSESKETFLVPISA